MRVADIIDVINGLRHCMGINEIAHTDGSSVQVDAIKVLIIGGTSNSLINFREPIIMDLIRAGAEVSCAAARDAKFEATRNYYAARGVRLYGLPLSRTGINPFREISSLLEVYRLVRKIRPCVIVSYTAKPVIYTGLALAAIGKVRFFPMITGLGYAFSDSKSFKVRVVNRIMRFAYRLSLAQAHTIIFQNEDDLTLFRRLQLVGHEARVRRVYGSGVDLSKYSKAPLPNRPTFLMLARLVAEKGVREYIRAAAIVRKQHPDAIFRLAGALDENPNSLTKSELDCHIKAGDIEYLGHLGDVREALAACRFYVLPSFYREGVPRSVTEAMATGRPILTTNSPGCRDTVEDGVNGFLIEPRSVDSLVQGCLKLLSLSDKEVQAMGENSHRFANEKFSAEAVNSDLLDIIEVRRNASCYHPVRSKGIEGSVES